MKKKITVVCLVVLAVAVAAGTAWWVVGRDAEPKPVLLSGLVTDINNGCQVDGTCSVTLDRSKEIITGCGLTAEGKTCRSYDQSKLEQGQHLEATVVPGKSAGVYTLECGTCGIREARR